MRSKRECGSEMEGKGGGSLEGKNTGNEDTEI